MINLYYRYYLAKENILKERGSGVNDNFKMDHEDLCGFFYVFSTFGGSGYGKRFSKLCGPWVGQHSGT